MDFWAMNWAALGGREGIEATPWGHQGVSEGTRDPAPAGTPQLPGLILGLFSPAVCLKILQDE